MKNGKASHLTKKERFDIFVMWFYTKCGSWRIHYEFYISIIPMYRKALALISKSFKQVSIN